MLQTKQINNMDEESLSTPTKRGQNLRRVYSEASSMVSSAIINDSILMNADQKEEQVQCECCGLSEVCTPTYISRIRSFFFGKWVCGLCAEAVKEKISKDSLIMEEALEAHSESCKKFIITARSNPKLHFVGAMREIARKSSLRRRSSVSNDQCGLPRIGRTMSCVAKIDGC